MTKQMTKQTTIVVFGALRVVMNGQRDAVKQVQSTLVILNSKRLSEIL